MKNQRLPKGTENQTLGTENRTALGDRGERTVFTDDCFTNGRKHKFSIFPAQDTKSTGIKKKSNCPEMVRNVPKWCLGVFRA